MGTTLLSLGVAAVFWSFFSLPYGATRNARPLNHESFLQPCFHAIRFSSIGGGDYFDYCNVIY